MYLKDFERKELLEKGRFVEIVIFVIKIVNNDYLDVTSVTCITKFAQPMYNLL